MSAILNYVTHFFFKMPGTECNIARHSEIARQMLFIYNLFKYNISFILN